LKTTDEDGTYETKRQNSYYYWWGDWHIENGKFGIRVNCISPGATRTQEFEDWVRVSAADAGISYEEMMSKIAYNNALKRIAEPSEIAACVVFLASDDSSAMIGHNLVASCDFHLIHPNMIH
jgi:NAD(P)-dependent dehydrogenase (short-subunit alcohol dehydrogenase family)